MKKLLLLLSVMVMYMVSYAAPVSPNLAKKVAYSFLSTRADLQGFDFTSVNLLHTEQAVSINDDNNQEVLNCFYIMTMGNKFVIVSADNIVQPVLAYAVGTTIDLQNIPESVQKWLDGYIEDPVSGSVDHLFIRKTTVGGLEAIIIWIYHEIVC